MEIVERVARAISGAPKAWEQLDGHRRASYLKQARAAIEAMREPSRWMLEAGSRLYVQPYEAEIIWDDMIDAAINPSPSASGQQAL